jgi:hypothetical protein
MASAERRGAEKAWWKLLVQMAALRGDDRAESFLSRKHEELLHVVNGEGPLETDEAREAAERWFRRKLKDHEAADRSDLCERLTKKLKSHASAWQGSDALERVEEALIQNTKEEGPLVCNMFAKELEGTRFEGVWISREKPGVYRLGDTRAAVQVLDGKLIVHGYFEGEFLHPVRVPIQGFLAEHGPASMRSATDDGLDLFGGGAGGQAQVRERSRSPAKAKAALPAGWEKRESRSRPGIFYYVNEAKGLTQFERPEA